MTISFVPQTGGPHFVIGIGGDGVTIHMGNVEATIDPDSAVELGRLLTRAGRFQEFVRDRERLNLARMHRRPR